MQFSYLTHMSSALLFSFSGYTLPPSHSPFSAFVSSSFTFVPSRLRPPFLSCFGLLFSGSDPHSLCLSLCCSRSSPPVPQGMLVSPAPVLRSKLEVAMSSRWLVAVFSRPEVVAVGSPVETRYVTLRTIRHLVAVDALDDKDSDSFFTPVLPKTAKLYLPVQDPLLRKPLLYPFLLLRPFYPLAWCYFHSARIDGSPPSAYVEYPGLILAEFQEYYDRMSHTFFSKQDQDYPFSRQLGDWPGRNLHVPNPEGGKRFLRPLLFVPLS